MLAAAAAGCGASATTGNSATSQLSKLIRSSLDHHRGFHVQAVACPKVHLAKGNVVVCAVTLRGGHALRMRATQVNERGTYHLVASEILPDNVERSIVASLAARDVHASALCPAHVPVVVGRSFDCRVTDRQGRRATAVVTIINRDSDFQIRIS